ncbi:MAG: rhodanese-related sulfurtransferase [Saprospiraceae bacterium]|nr:rhodanese-related sulfurtransferase [Candidatus Opimibacter skivensis]MBL0008201.1 rhodanese-related sulfurtransferase [Candidatus Opimibacter skivensis]MBP8086194.1 rhodanese-related sulfurtransferase [Saprospiraceae bacterium]MBP9744526.1 rhodanese-related sulfurtransferase [Saprospiraceae bacterium]
MGKLLHNRVNRDELRHLVQLETKPRTTLSFYAYTRLADPHAFRDAFYASLHELGVFGRIYVASEGVNAQISLPTEHMEAFRQYLDTIPFLRNIRLNIAVEDDGKSFFTLAIKVREKIVADGLDDAQFDVTDRGVHLSASAFNQLTDDPDTIVVDMRNYYESEVGHFEKAILPPMETFRDGLPMVAEMLSDAKEKHVVMYCTGGIRCEKASAYMKYRGYKNVYQLDGGIIEYARQAEKMGIPNKFLGKNFVFDERLGERISDDVVSTCHQCGKPSDDHTNCANDACHILFIQCPECKEKYHGCCTVECSDFSALSREERRIQRRQRVFNGSKYSKAKPGLLLNEK